MSEHNTPIHYQVSVRNLHAHQWEVVLSLQQPNALQLLQLPVWIPGSYMVREFSKQLSDITAMQNGTACVLEQTAKGTWQVDTDPSLPLQVRYTVHAIL